MFQELRVNVSSLVCRDGGNTLQNISMPDKTGNLAELQVVLLWMKDTFLFSFV